MYMKRYCIFFVFVLFGFSSFVSAMPLPVAEEQQPDIFDNMKGQVAFLKQIKSIRDQGNDVTVECKQRAITNTNIIFANLQILYNTPVWIGALTPYQKHWIPITRQEIGDLTLPLSLQNPRTVPGSKQ